MDNERLPKQLLYGDVAMGSYRQEGQVRSYKDTLKTSLKQLQINPATWEDLTQNRPAWRKTVNTGAEICEANKITAAKTKRAARKSPAPRTNTINAQALPTCQRCQRTFRARIGLVGNLRTQCTNNPTIRNSTSTSASNPSDSPLAPWHQFHYSHHHRDYIPIIITCDPPPTTATITTISDGDSLLNCPHCDRTFSSHIGLVRHLRIHRTETGEP
ncbi:unnamed protein product [Schistocephalus solidus]|uniref:C2H2-type domain-containing protein n=1 Tax=Schistocephalus solidus TaxID=70667 RepID=A0A183SH26_SCHSO|nr:unnamed protein product [Schistocephalus solidus]